MAHDCPICYARCHCHGDIDDCCFDDPYYVNKCDHCPDDEPDTSDSEGYPPEF